MTSNQSQNTACFVISVYTHSCLSCVWDFWGSRCGESIRFISAAVWMMLSSRLCLRRKTETFTVFVSRCFCCFLQYGIALVSSWCTDWLRGIQTGRGSSAFIGTVPKKWAVSGWELNIHEDRDQITLWKILRDKDKHCVSSADIFSYSSTSWHRWCLIMTFTDHVKAHTHAGTDEGHQTDTDHILLHGLLWCHLWVWILKGFSLFLYLLWILQVYISEYCDILPHYTVLTFAQQESIL